LREAKFYGVTMKGEKFLTDCNLNNELDGISTDKDHQLLEEHKEIVDILKKRR